MASTQSKKKAINTLMAIALIGVLVFISHYYLSAFAGTKAQTNNAAMKLPDNHPSVTALDSKNYTFPAENKYCLSCHQGIEPARPLLSEMMLQILKKGAELGDPNGCVVCHGGQPNELKNKHTAHSGVPKGSLLKAFTPVPAALQVNENTCGACHADHTYNAHRSTMNTDAGKMKAIAWSWGIDTENKDHIYGDHNLDDPDGDTPRFGTDKYKQYMKQMAAAFPGQFPKSLKQIPEVSYADVEKMPEMAAFTYLRNCNACHLSNKGYQDRGHFRGMGCAACHNLYSNEGYYEGNDPSIDTQKPGHLLVHSMQGTRKTKIKINGEVISGIQVSTCAACHAAGRRIGHAYQGLMAYGHGDNRGPFNEKGMPQEANGGYVFKYIRNDAHHRIDKDGKSVTGLLCQDCHTTNEMHGNGNIGATTLATVEIECADCHGTPEKYPWELPLGFGDEFNRKLDMKDARGVADEPLKVTRDFGTPYARQDGYLLSARGNPLGNVARSGDKVIVHSDAGYDFEAPLLKTLTKQNRWTNPLKAKTAMVSISKHIEKMECYACHSTWAAQYYGFKHVMDYTKTSADWLASPESYGADGTTADYHQKPVMQPGASTYWDYSHVRWENPPLGINGEGRVTPLTGVIQTVGTVIDKNGNTLIWNNAAKTKAGYNAMELAPLNPHTTSKASRDCSDCHGNSAAMGYGIDYGVYDNQPSVARYADVVTADGKNVSKYTKAQINAIAKLHGDFMQLINANGEQQQTIDTHWPTSMPLTNAQIDVLARAGTCLACHQDIPKGAIPIRMLGKIAQISNLSFADEASHAKLIKDNNMLVSWIKAGGIIACILLIPLAIIAFIKRKKIKKFFSKMKS